MASSSHSRCGTSSMGRRRVQGNTRRLSSPILETWFGREICRLPRPTKSPYHKTRAFFAVLQGFSPLSPVRKNIDFLSDGAVGRETLAATPSEFRDIAEEGAESRKPFVYWASCAIRGDEKTAHHLRGVSDLVCTDGGDAERKTNHPENREMRSLF